MSSQSCGTDAAPQPLGPKICLGPGELSEPRYGFDSACGASRLLEPCKHPELSDCRVVLTVPQAYGLVLA